MAGIRHFGFSNFQFFFMAYQVGVGNMRRHTKFHQNRSKGCGDVAFTVFQNGGRPPSRIFKIEFLNSEGQYAADSKFRQN